MKKLLLYSDKKIMKVRSIIEIILDNPRISQIEIAKEIGTADRTVTRYMTDMKNAGLIAREGADNCGNWIVLI